LETDCTTVTCSGQGSICPVITSFTASPKVIPESETSATIEVTAEDPDDNPEPLVTTYSAEHGAFDDLHAGKATFTCDSDVGGPIEICVEASDGGCAKTRCISVYCPDG
jgi:hypothetical protein